MFVSGMAPRQSWFAQCSIRAHRLADRASGKPPSCARHACEQLGGSSRVCGQRSAGALCRRYCEGGPLSRRRSQRCEIYCTDKPALGTRVKSRQTCLTQEQYELSRQDAQKAIAREAGPAPDLPVASCRIRNALRAHVPGCAKRCIRCGRARAYVGKSPAARTRSDRRGIHESFARASARPPCRGSAGALVRSPARTKKTQKFTDSGLAPAGVISGTRRRMGVIFVPHVYI